MTGRDDAVKAAYHALQERWTCSGDPELTEADAAAVVDAVRPIVLREAADILDYAKPGTLAGQPGVRASVTYLRRRADRLEREAGRG